MVPLHSASACSSRPPCAMLEQILVPSLDGDAPILVALALFFIGILVGVPVGFVLLLATATYLLASGAASLVVLPQTMVNGTGNFILLAVPFFIPGGADHGTRRDQHPSRPVHRDAGRPHARRPAA